MNIGEIIFTNLYFCAITWIIGCAIFAQLTKHLIGIDFSGRCAGHSRADIKSDRRHFRLAICLVLVAFSVSFLLHLCFDQSRWLAYVLAPTIAFCPGVRYTYNENKNRLLPSQL